MLLLTRLALGLGATVALATVYIFHEGLIRLDVDEQTPGGSHIHLWLPATTVSVGLRLAPRRPLSQAARKARPYLPALREVSKELERCPNAELLDLTDRTSHVRLSVRQGQLFLDVVTNADNIHISAPAATLEDLADRLEALAPGV